MPKARHYPPSHVRYQLDNPPVTIHLNRKLKENLDAVKGSRSYAQVMTEILTNKFELQKEIVRLPVNEAVISYIRGFHEAWNRYASWGICNKCGNEWTLWKDGKCDRCHKEGGHPQFSHFRDPEPVKTMTEEDLEKAKVKLPRLERLSYENGKKKGYEDGWGDGYDEAERDFKITYPCSICGKPVEMKYGDDDYKDMVRYLKEQGWHHGSCGNQ